MLLTILACDEDIVKIDKHEIQLTKDAVHKALEGLSGVLKTEWHTKEFVEAKKGVIIAVLGISSGAMGI